MPMEAAEIETLILNALPPGTRVMVEDLRGDGDHYAVTVESPAFYGVAVVDQHRMVFSALQGRVGGLLKDMTLTTVALDRSMGFEG